MRQTELVKSLQPMDKQTFRLTDLHEMCFKTTKVVVTNKWS